MADNSTTADAGNGIDNEISENNGDVAATALSILNVRDFCNNLTQSLSKELLKNGNGVNNGMGLERRQLGTLLDRPDFQALLRLHKLVSAHRTKNIQPLESDASSLLEEFARRLGDDEAKSVGGRHTSPTTSTSRKGTIPNANLIDELRRLLESTHFRSLLNAHDRVARKEFEPCLPEVPYEVDEDDGSAVKIVRLIKNNEPLGATIKVSAEFMKYSEDV